jgi:hypothetical protein
VAADGRIDAGQPGRSVPARASTLGAAPAVAAAAAFAAWALTGTEPVLPSRPPPPGPRAVLVPDLGAVVQPWGVETVFPAPRREAGFPDGHPEAVRLMEACGRLHEAMLVIDPALDDRVGTAIRSRLSVDAGRRFCDDVMTESGGDLERVRALVEAFEQGE